MIMILTAHENFSSRYSRDTSPGGEDKKVDPRKLKVLLVNTLLPFRFATADRAHVRFGS